MTSRKVPGVATWILKHFGCSPNNEAILGDIEERYQEGPGAIWYWRQIIVALVTGCLNETRAHKWPVLRAIATGWLLHLLVYPVTNETVWTKVLAWLSLNVAGLLVFSMVMAILIFGTITIGWVVARIGAEYKKPAVIGYAISSLIYGTSVFFLQQYLFWLRSPIPLTLFLRSIVLPLFLFFLVFAAVGTILVLFGGGLLPVPATQAVREDS